MKIDKDEVKSNQIIESSDSALDNLDDFDEYSQHDDYDDYHDDDDDYHDDYYHEDDDYHYEDDDYETTWAEVATACFSHDLLEWVEIVVGTTLLLGLLYLFLVCLKLISVAARVVGGCAAGGLLFDAVDNNPVTAFLVGVVTTAMSQSVGMTTSVASSSVGVGIMGIDSAVCVIMGANVGASATSTVVALARLTQRDELERAFAGTTLNVVFNVLTVLVFLPLELATGSLRRVGDALVPDGFAKSESWVAPVKRIVSPVASKILSVNKDVITNLVTGEVASCSSFYPVDCTGPKSKENCNAGLIDCDGPNGECPRFFDKATTQYKDQASGVICMLMAVVLLMICVNCVVKLLRVMLAGVPNRILYKVTNLPSLLAVLLGGGITVLTGGVSVTTALLTPLVGLDLLRLEQMFPLTVGANIGAGVVGLLAATDATSLRVAVSRVLLLVAGALVWYPWHTARQVPLTAARNLGAATRLSRTVPLLYAIVVFVALPLACLGVTLLYLNGSVLGSLIIVSMIGTVASIVYWYRHQGGKDVLLSHFSKRRRSMSGLTDSFLDYSQRRRRVLPDDLDNSPSIRDT